MARLRLRLEAKADILEIWDHVAGHNPTAARRLIDALLGRIGRLAVEPLIGRARPDLKPGLRSFPSGKYLIFYTYVDDMVDVVRVLHGARDLPTIFEDDAG